MYTPQALQDMHERCHRSLRMVMEHCRSLEDGALDRELEGFGYGTIRLQLHHIIGAQGYWLSVLEDRMNADDDSAEYTDLDSLASFRAEVFQAVDAYLAATPPEVLNTPREYKVWSPTNPEGTAKSLRPVDVVLRTEVHIFQHVGQITAMCRLLGRPVPPGMDYPLV